MREPALAAELGIGRPDLPRTYDDGGLVDVNHVPLAAFYRAFPQLDAASVNRIVEVRSVVGRFESLDEMLMLTGLSPQTFDEVEDFLVFR